jgi:hypothetical protein
MLLLEAVESQLGALENWPTAVLTILFAYDPLTLNALQKLESVIAFLM